MLDLLVILALVNTFNNKLLNLTYPMLGFFKFKMYSKKCNLTSNK